MKESYKKGESDSILALSLAQGIARCGQPQDFLAADFSASLCHHGIPTR
jgi:hypothetical protein